MKRNNWFFLVVFVLLVGCGKAPIYEKSYSFKSKEWTRDVKPSFEVDISDIEKKYNFTILLRTTTDYNYSNLWIFLKTEAPDGTSAREPFEIILANPEGAWLGNKTGTVVETALYFKERKLPLKGKYKFTIEQGITSTLVDEVLDITLIVDEQEKP